MKIHSKFLVHWTGKDITHEKTPSRLTEEENTKFLSHFRDIVKNGLLMGMGTEKIYGRENTSITITIPRVCFTEIKLSQAVGHAQKYGFLGVGFNRKFVLTRNGNPVFYIQNGRNGIVIENLDYLHKYVKNDKQKLRELEVILGFLKNMSDKDTYNLTYYDEMEWRILHSDLLEAEERIQKKDGLYYLKFLPKDVRIIVFPNLIVRKKALKDNWLKENFFDKYIPMMTTVSDCTNF